MNSITRYFLFFKLFPVLLFANISIPPLSSNVIDLSNRLSSSEKIEILKSIEIIRSEADTFAAVLITNSLDGESIESLAERAFNQWGLGREKDDNGLLLLLSLNERKSRLEVGYGLEGHLTDLHSKRILDYQLAPLMRQGKMKDALISSLLKSSEIISKSRAGEPIGTSFGSSKFIDDLIKEDKNPKRAAIVFLLYLCALWLLPAFVKRLKLRLAKELSRNLPEYQYHKDINLFPKAKINNIPKQKARQFGSLFIRCFFSINPGVFIIIFSSMYFLAAFVVVTLIVIVSVIYYLKTTSKYKSPEKYLEHVEKQKLRMGQKLKKGYVEKETLGVYSYTPTWYASAEYRSTRVSRSGSSSFSSSSSGGSSGGGGASSSW